uniref:Protein DPCD n=1 Tax=Corethrella appendiculata TaxID=1370023 RepID=U5ELK9_9DIPT
MSYIEWLNRLKSADKTSVIQGNVRKIHYKFHNGLEMAEEYSIETGIVLRRAWKESHGLMKKDKWNIELGENVVNYNADPNGDLLKESVSEPFLVKRITRHAIEWRIRNLPYPIEVYSVSVDVANKSLIVRTANKKYYKLIQVQEFERCNYEPKQQDLSIRHQSNTLIITYKKPQILIEMEKAVLIELQNVETMEYDDVDCRDLLKELIS